jgi:osmotically-inducible protein OsmY
MTIREDGTILLEDQVQLTLRHNPYLTRKPVHCEAREGRVVIRGEVGSFFQKQMATEALRKLRGIEQIDNQLEVVWQ